MFKRLEIFEGIKKSLCFQRDFPNCKIVSIRVLVYDGHRAIGRLRFLLGDKDSLGKDFGKN